MEASLLNNDDLNTNPIILAHGLLKPDDSNAEFRNVLFVNWCLTNMCNYNCSYCFGHKKISRNNFSPTAGVIRAAKHILSLDRSFYRFTITGGEPTIHPGFFDLQDFIFESGKKTSIHVITNGSRGPVFFDRWVKNSNDKYFSVSISYHSEYADISKIIESLEILSSSGKSVNLSLMFNPEKTQIIKKIHNALCVLREKFPFTCQIVTLRVGQSHSVLDPRYTPADLEWVDHANQAFKNVSAKSIPQITSPYRIPGTLYKIIDDNEEKMIPSTESFRSFRNGHKAFKGFYCCTGTNLINIGPTGHYRGAVCDLSRHSRESLYHKGTFTDKDISKIIRCSLDGCGCVSNDPIPKFRYLEDAREHISIMGSN